MATRRWPVRFRIYNPGPKTHQTGRFGFWDALVFRTPDELRAFAASDEMHGGAYHSPRMVGFCRALEFRNKRGGWKPNQRGRRGVVMLCIPYCGVGVVSHELTHAAHYELASHQKREPLTLKDDERLAWLQGELVRRFWNGFYRRFRQRGRSWVRL